MLFNKERVSREVLTIHGYVSYTRTLLVPADSESKKRLLEITGQKSVCPVDDAMGVSNLPFKMTYRMMSHIAKEAVIAHSYVEATGRINEGINRPISVTTVEHVTDYVGKLMYDNQSRSAIELKNLLTARKIDKRKIHKRNDDVLYIELDGAMIHIRDKEHVELSNDEICNNLNRVNTPGWTESKHALCFHASAIKYYYKDAQDNHYSGRFSDVLSLGKGYEIAGHSIESRDCIGYIGCSDVFQYHLLLLAERNNWKYCAKVVLLSDGAKWIKSVKDNVFQGRPVIQILDLYHAKENAGKFAKWIKRGKKQKEAYADHLCKLIDQGKVGELLAELEQYKDRKPPAGVPNLYSYISNNRDYMDYPRYKAQGLFVGSGAMESANIYMMQNRMKLPGMRWSVVKGRHMLCLKTHYVSRTWNQVEQQLMKRCGISG